MRRTRLLAVVVAVAAVMNVSRSVEANNWPQWRGPFFNGSTDETGLPERWSRTENVRWVAQLPGASASTPVVWENHVFVSAVDYKREMLVACCYDARSGQRLWCRDISQGIRKNRRSTYAAPSPVTDGQRVFFFYGNGDFVAFDFNGKQLWRRNIQKDYGQFAFLWTFSSSPTLYRGKLYLQVLQRDVPVHKGRASGVNESEGQPIDSYLLALDPKTGNTLWKQNRPSEAVKEAREAYSTPIPLEYNGRRELLIVGGDDITGHDPETGKELWRWGTWNPKRIGHWRLVPSPVTGTGVILVCAPKRSPIYAIRAGGNGRLTDKDVLWVSNPRELTSDVATPAFYDGDFFVLSDLRQTLARVEPKTGKIKWLTRLPRGAKYEASPLVADGKVYVVNFDAKVSVYNAADGRQLAVIDMGPTDRFVVRSSIVAAQGCLFIRTTDKLYCIGK